MTVHSRSLTTLTTLTTLGLALAAATAAAPPARAGDALVMNGQVASTDVRTINGSAYVRLADVARALGMVAVKRPGGGYELRKAGGADQIAGVSRGKVGDVLFDGRWRLQVLGVETPASYTMKADGRLYDLGDTAQFDPRTLTVQAKPGNTLVLVRCRVSNGQKSSQTLWLAPKDNNTALADAQGQSYKPLGYDIEGSPIQTKPLLPGAKVDLPVLFSVPQGTDIQDLVFTLHNNDSSQKPNDVRVSLKQP